MDINFLAVFLAALSAFFLGFIWYTVIFAKTWQKEIGLSTDGTKSNVQPPNLGKLLLGSFILELIIAFVLSYFLHGDAEFKTGLILGLWAGVLVAGAFGVNYLFEGKSLMLWFINATYNVVVFATMGAIIGAM